jgi:signal transduction histidine kinase
MDEIPITYYASAKRTSIPKLLNQNNVFESNKLLCEVLNAVPDIVLILNSDRQIIFTNQTVLLLLEKDSFKSILGMRPGELLNCEHSFETKGGCGTSEFCKTCGAVNAILNSQKGIADVQECRITQRGDLDALDFKVFATPLSINGNKFTIFSVIDISHEKRRRMLEKIFLHDIINTASSLRVAVNLLSEADRTIIPEYTEMILNLSDSLIEEIVTQREIAAAETNDLRSEMSIFNSLELLKEITRFYSIPERGKDKLIQIDPGSSDISINSDRVLLRRVLGNMLKNALEGTEPGGTIIAGCNKLGNNVCFWVHNDSYIPRDYQLQIFQRSFTTKGIGRGIGTYSIKLLTEKYLKGKVSFTSSEENGTVFTVICPLQLPLSE